MVEMGKKCQVIAMILLVCENFQKTLGKTCFFSVICVFFRKNSPLSPNQKKWKKKEHPCEQMTLLPLNMSLKLDFMWVEKTWCH
jgi:hypothetical protein